MKKLAIVLFTIGALLVCGAASAQSFSCNLANYKPVNGLQAEMAGGALQFMWQGENGQELRAQFTIRDGEPTILELAARKTTSSGWTVLAKNVVPEFRTTAGGECPSRKRTFSRASALT